ncbi:MAG: AraC family transcriptional regulator [Clostridium perfringens]|uniref:AraC family transcriptional regulator n=1 Tax=Clostridium perfringens TaxID=1502 RepID=UPI00115C2633|nr:AraC family transcriptional regulator [Clostridium perfringens]MDU7109496.1 AraC family transcriptional regulator [Clostridium perfringens]
MENVNKVYITAEVAKKLDLNPSYLIRIAKELKDNGTITENDLRLAGKRNYLFNERAINELSKKITK